MFPKIAVITMPVRHFFDLIALFAKDYEFFLRPFRCSFRLVEASIRLPHVLDSTRRKTLKPFCRHNP